jgi:purine nucleosidase
MRSPRGYVEAYGRFDGLDGCCLHDVAAAAYVLRPGLFTVRAGGLSVALEGERLGQTRWDAAGRSQQVCVEVEAALLVERFLGPSAPPTGNQPTRLVLLVPPLEPT